MCIRDRGPLLRLLSGDEHFLLLALSQRRVRLLEGSRDRVEELELGEVPSSLLGVTEPAEPRSHTMARPLSAAGRGGPAVFYGYGCLLYTSPSPRDRTRY